MADISHNIVAFNFDHFHFQEAATEENATNLWIEQ
jgi:hypothetical protein